MSRIIGLSGKARCGKDTVAEYISAVYSGVEVYALAGPLKEAASIMFNIPLNHFFDADKKEVEDGFWGISPREIAQKVGTECGREVFRQDFWLKRCESQMNDAPDIFIVSDIRFDNEADWVKEQGGQIWHIERPDLGEGVVRDHISENGVTICPEDIIIENDSSLTELYLNIDNLMTEDARE